MQMMADEIVFLKNRNNQLVEDTQSYVRQIVDLKETMANGMNDVLGGLTSGSVKKHLSDEASKFEPSIKSEYFKMAGINEKHIEVPSSVEWKTCAHKIETTCAAFNRDGDIIYTGGADGLVRGWRTSDGKALSTMTL